MQNREMIMHKVGKWFMIIGIAGVLSLLFIEELNTIVRKNQVNSIKSKLS